MEMSETNGKFCVTRTAPVKKIMPSKLFQYADASACEMSIQIGIFFDGTGNNLYLHKKNQAHSNVARLYDAYRDSPETGSYREYLPGLGTPFPQIGEDTDSTMGSAFASGGDSRIVFALLRVFDVIHRSLFRTEMFDPDLRKALCKTSLSKADKKQLQKVGLVSSLVDGDARIRSGSYLNICAESIQRKMQTQRAPKVCECCLDIFGFSRGATEARVFCHWLNDLLNSSGLVGIPLRFRFLGIIDTVASVGIWDGITNHLLGSTGGHSNWATPAVMWVLPKVENCVHLVAMHELRKNFPLDTVSFNHDVPSNCVEFAYPGSHSDVGGGYEPGELGVSAGDSLKLSQIPLNHMYDCAVAAGVPLSKGMLGAESKGAFAVHDEVSAAFKQFIDVLTDVPRSLSDWALPYLVWRWQARDVYEKTGHFMKSNPEDRRHLRASNQQFCGDDKQMQIYADSKTAKWQKRPYDREGTQATLPALESEAPELRARVIAQSKISPTLAAFFDNFVHDSVAGFRKQLVEPTGIWRYRRVFRGSATAYTG